MLMFGLLILTLAVYQASIVPDQHAQAELEHFEATQTELVELRDTITAAGHTGHSQFSSLRLGTTYDSAFLAINPPPPAGTIQTTEKHNITIANQTDQTNVSTRFVEYQPGYSELSIDPTRLEQSVLYVDGRDRGDNVSVIEDQTIVTDETVSITALQNEFRQTDTGRVSLELYPLNAVDESELPDRDGENFTVTVPTRLDDDDYWDETLADSTVYEGVDTEEHGTDTHALNLSVAKNNLELNTVGLHSAPAESPAKTTGPAVVTDGTISVESIDDVDENEDDQTQEFVFTAETALEEGTNVSITVSEPNDAGVEYEDAAIDIAEDTGEASSTDDGDTLAFEAGEDIAEGQSVTVTVDELTVGQDAAGAFGDISFTREDNDDTDTGAFEVVAENTITADSITNLIEGQDNQEQEFEFTLDGELREGENVSIDVSEQNGNLVDYQNATIDTAGVGQDGAEINDDGDTIHFTSGKTDGEVSIVIDEIDVKENTVGQVDDIRFTREDSDASDIGSFEITDTITANRIDNLLADEDDQEQTFEFTLETDLDTSENVAIDLSEPNGSGVDYENAEVDDDDDGEIINNGETLEFEPENPSGNEDVSITVMDIDVADGVVDDFDITFTRSDDGSTTESFEIREDAETGEFTALNVELKTNEQGPPGSAPRPDEVEIRSFEMTSGDTVEFTATEGSSENSASEEDSGPSGSPDTLDLGGSGGNEYPIIVTASIDSGECLEAEFEDDGETSQSLEDWSSCDS